MRTALLIALCAVLIPSAAETVMADQGNPVCIIKTSEGDIHVELLSKEGEEFGIVIPGGQNFKIEKDLALGQGAGHIQDPLQLDVFGNSAEKLFDGGDTDCSQHLAYVFVTERYVAHGILVWNWLIFLRLQKFLVVGG